VKKYKLFENQNSNGIDKEYLEKKGNQLRNKTGGPEEHKPYLFDY